MTMWPDKVSIIRAPLVTDVYGDSRGWDAAVTVGTYAANVQPVSDRSSSGDPDRETLATYLRIYIHGLVDIQPGDRARYQGKIYEVRGAPRVWAIGGYTVVDVKAVDG